MKNHYKHFFLGNKRGAIVLLWKTHVWKPNIRLLKQSSFKLNLQIRLLNLGLDYAIF